MDVSRHAIKRIRQRLGINKSAAEGMALDAIENGLGPEVFSGSLRKYLDKLAITHQGHYRVTPNAVFCIKGDVLTTVWPLPQKYRNAVLNEREKVTLSEESS